MAAVLTIHVRRWARVGSHSHGLIAMSVRVDKGVIYIYRTHHRACHRVN